MTIKELEIELKKLNINLTSATLKKLETYKNLLQEYNKKFNLTTIIKDEDIYLKHFYDSLTLSKACDLTKPLNVLDIGTGAGFPGLILKIIFPNLHVTLLDSNNKKINFLKEVIAKLNLTNVECLNMRAEALPVNYREYFDIVTSRAVASLRVLSELSIPYLNVGGLFLPMKAILKEELEEALPTITKLSSKVIKEYSFTLPIENSKRTILVIKKEAETLNIYPRSYDKIIKKPL